jgi:hypothetical protein
MATLPQTPSKPKYTPIVSVDDPRYAAYAAATCAAVRTPRTPKARFAHLDGVAGIALCDAQGVVSFLAESTGLWSTLTNADLPRITLLGDLALVEAQKLQDERFGSLLHFIDYRNTEHRRTPRAA